MSREAEYRYSEIFRSIQGEGHYTGIPTVWYRAWGCNFECLGFGSNNPENVKAEDLPFMKTSLDGVDSVEQLPVFKEGCDSSYSWSKRYAHLASKGTRHEISERIRDLLPDRTFRGKSNQPWHMAFTGGEPMMSQSAVVGIMEAFDLSAKWDHTFLQPEFVTIETNGTQKVRDVFRDYFETFVECESELFWSVSPKLKASGEEWNKAIRPEVLAEYNRISKHGQLKFVVDGTDEVWEEVDTAVRLYRALEIDWPVWIMPVGARREEQEDIQAKICEQTLNRGYNFSARVHCWIFGNKIGT